MSEKLDREYGLYRISPRRKWIYIGGAHFRVLNLWRWWLIVRIERKGHRWV